MYYVVAALSAVRSTRLGASIALAIAVFGARVAPATADPSPAFLVRDIGQAGPARGSAPRGFVAIGPVTYFAASTATHGEELWRSDGTPGGTALVKDAVPGNVYPSPLNALTAVGNRVFFVTQDPEDSLWVSDGTADGTVSLEADLSIVSWDLEAVALGNLFLFVASSPGKGYELWRSDGTPEGTYPIDLLPGYESSDPSDLRAIGGHVYFGARSENGREPWRTDGTPAGTHPIADVAPGPLSSGPTDFVELGGAVLFAAASGDPASGASDRELWRTDGTAPGTTRVADILAGGASGSPEELTRVGDVVYFRAYDGDAGEELWRTDGTTVGTIRVRDIAVPGDSSPRHLTTVGDELFFTADDGLVGRELWRSDGTEIGTVRVADLEPGPGSLALDTPLAFAGALFFVRIEAGSHPRLWRSNGSEPGTAPFADLVVDPFQVPPPLGVAAGSLWLAGDDGVHGVEPWRSDGSPGDLELVADIARGNGDGALLFGGQAHLPGGGALVFTADDGLSGREPWRSDGTAGGTYPLGDLLPGSSGSNPTAFQAFDGGVFFQAFAVSPTSGELWRTDGSEAGTRIVAGPPPLLSPNGLVLERGPGGALYFAGGDDAGYELWRTDGDAPGTFRVKDLLPGTVRNPAASSNPTSLVGLGDHVYFSARHPTAGRELWRSDGTEAGTELVTDLDGDALPFELFSIRSVRSRLVFRATTPAFGSELWTTDGTAADTQVIDLLPGPLGSLPELVGTAGGILYFEADVEPPRTDRSLYFTDGTPAGTQIVPTVPLGDTGGLASLGSTLFVHWSWAGLYGIELGRTDGVPGRTRLFDLNPGRGSSHPGSAVAVGPIKIVFAAQDDAFGRELWATTTLFPGAVRVLDLVPGSGDSDPEPLGVVGDTLLFSADDGQGAGRELWGVPLAALAFCGDSEVDAARGEECDDGNASDGDRCDAACRRVPEAAPGAAGAAAGLALAALAARPSRRRTRGRGPPAA